MVFIFQSNFLVQTFYIYFVVYQRRAWSWRSQSCFNGSFSAQVVAKDSIIARNWTADTRPTSCTHNLNNTACFSISYRIFYKKKLYDNKRYTFKVKETEHWQHIFGCDNKGICSGRNDGKCTKYVPETKEGSMAILCCCNGTKCNTPKKVFKILKAGVSSCYFGVEGSQDGIRKTSCLQSHNPLDNSWKAAQKQYTHIYHSGHKSHDLKPFFCYNISYHQGKDKAEFHCDLPNHCLKLGMSSPYAASQCMKINMPGNKTATVCCCTKNNCNYMKTSNTKKEDIIKTVTGPSSTNKALIVTCAILAIVLVTTCTILLYKKLAGKQPAQPLVLEITYDRLLAAEA